MRVRLTATALAVLGAGLVTAGVWMVYRPAGLIVGGLILMAVGVEALRPPRGSA